VDVLAHLSWLLVGLLVALLARHLHAVLLRHLLAVLIRHLDQFLFLHVITLVHGVVLAGARHLHPLLAAVAVRLPSCLTVVLVAGPTLSLSVGLRLLPLLGAAHIFILSVTLLLVDGVTDVPIEGLGLGLALLFGLLDVLSLPNLLIGGGALYLRSRSWSLDDLLSSTSTVLGS